MYHLHLDDMDIYVSVYKYIDSNMYILLAQNEALVVDPHTDAEVEAHLARHKVRKVTLLLTHEHPDHISGIWWFRENFDCTLICSEKCAAKIANPRSVRPLLLAFILEENDRKNGTNVLSEFKGDYVERTYAADVSYHEELQCSWQGHGLLFKAIQGHSAGSSVIILDGRYAFTWDSLLKDYPVIVSFPQGNKDLFLTETIPLLEKMLLPDMTVLPGHGKPFVLSDMIKDGRILVNLR